MTDPNAVPPEQTEPDQRTLLGLVTHGLSVAQWLIIYVAIGVAALAVVLALDALPTSKTAVDLIADCDSVELRLGEAAYETQPILVSEIQVVEPKAVQGLAPPLEAAGPLLSLTAAGTKPITLQGLPLTKGTVVALRRLPERSGAVEIVVKPGNIDIELVTQDAFTATNGRQTMKVPAGAPQVVTVRGADRQAVIRVKLAEEDFTFGEPMAIAGLSFTEIVGRTGQSRVFSSIQNGSVRFEDIGGKERSLRAREPLQIDRVSGLVRRLRVTEKSIHIELSGDVSGLRTGWTGQGRSLMPSVFEVMSANKVANTVSAMMLAVLSLIMGVTSFVRGGAKK